MQAQRLQQVHRAHGRRDARAIVNRALRRVPGIQMSRDDDDVLGPLTSGPVGDDIVALDLRQ